MAPQHYNIRDEEAIKALSTLLGIEPASVRNYIIIAHTHDDDEICRGHMETMTNARPGMARTIAIGYAEKLVGLD